jgi:hypothetical protein
MILLPISRLTPLIVVGLGATTLAFASSAISSTSLAPGDGALAEPVIAISSRPTAKPSASIGGPSFECPRLRRKLWLEGEGWVVRRVSACP